MKNLLRLLAILTLTGIPGTLRAGDTVTFGPGTVGLLLRQYSLQSNSAVLCATPIPDYPIQTPFSANRGEQAQAIATYLQSTFGIHLSRIEDGISIATLGHESPPGAPAPGSLPKIIVGGNLHFSYRLDGGPVIKKTVTAE
jgi:hypothetical protein